MPKRSFYYKPRYYDSTNELMKAALGKEYPETATQEQIDRFLNCIGEDKGRIAKLHYDEHLEIWDIAKITGDTTNTLRRVIDSLGRLYRAKMDEWYLCFYGFHMPIDEDTKILFIDEIPINTRSRLANRGIERIRDITQYTEKEFCNLLLSPTYKYAKHYQKVGPATTARFKALFDKHGLAFKEEK